MSASNQILDAIELLIKDSVKKAAYDRTIQAQIISCEDQTIGKYKCRYQDAIIYAYSGSADISYSQNAQVYILVPENDMQKEKTILGATQKLGINYISQAEGEDAYDIVGNNNIKTNRTFYLDTRIKGYIQTIYKKDSITNLLTIDKKALKEYLKKSSSIVVGAYFKTNIDLERQYRGHYGIRMSLSFKDNATEQSVIRSYVLDQDNMIDNPYRLSFKTRQCEIFNIDGENFEDLQSIEIFCSDFPETDEPEQKEGLLSKGDIEITSFQLYGANRMTVEEINGVAVSFVTPEGTFFDTNNTFDKTITAQVKIKGKVASSAQNIKYYWGMEDNRITPKSEYYNKYLGRGWKCLNESNIIKEAVKEGEKIISDPVVEWKPAKETYVMKFSDAIVKDNRIKVAIFYDGTVITKEINIQNLVSSIPKITIESSGGTQFYYDIGHPNLTCKVNGKQQPNYSYYWSYTSNTGFFENLDTTTKENEDYDKAVKDLTKTQNEIKKGYAKQKATELQDRKDAVTAFNFIQRVENNHIYNVQINRITLFGIFKCSVYNNNDIYLGTASITLTNKLEGEGVYSLVINNGSETFQYDQAGISPTNGSKQTPQQLEALSFTIYDNLGQPIEDKSNKYKIKWEFPIKNTLLQNKNGKETGISPDGNYKYYNSPTIIYGIANNYSISKQRNQVKLTVDYNNMHLVSSTSFSFVKQGEAGTNGTDYVVKIVPNTTNPPLFPMITYNQAEGVYFDNVFNTDKNPYSSQLLKVELWKSGELQDLTKNNIIPKWEILKNNYGSGNVDFSAFTINATSGAISYKNFLIENGQTDSTVASACIVKCSIIIDEKTYYGTIPIITAKIKNSSYRIKLKDYTGFRYVMYSDNGLFPQYDKTNPFEFICEQEINKIWQDVSLAEGNYRKDFSYKVIGNYYNNGIKSSNLLSFNSTGLSKNQRKLIPASKYDGVCINNSLICSCYGYDENNKSFLVAKINVPIHFLLNKYGLANINAWDGNSVQVNKDGGFILSPQVGAGTKDENNNFTGILIGEVKYQNRVENGLLGYGNGERTIFLNSKNGSATFGRSGKGQIVIDPTNNQEALIYGGNYNSKNGTGMLINLSAPYIKFGSGKFEVNESGHLTAKGGGSIAGWNIGDDALTSNKGNITLKNDGSIYSNIHSAINNTNNGFFLSQDGLSIGSKIKISNTGVVTVGPGAVNNKNKYHWTINGDTSRAYIAYGGENKVDTADGTTDNSAKVYLGTDGISLGKRFSVTAQGSLRAYSGIIGGWTIGSTTLSANKIIINSSGTISGGNYDAEKQQGWQITGGGYAEFNKATIRGKITANSGRVGGWTIGDNFLKSQNGMITLHAGSTEKPKTNPYIQVGIKSTSTSYIRINSDGSIISQNYDSEDSTGWKINGNGNAFFQKGTFGPWTVNTMGKDDENAFRGTIKDKQGKSKSILIKANGNILGQDISEGDKTTDYWQIVDSQAYFGNGLIVGPTKAGNKNRWIINPGNEKNNKKPVIYSFHPDARIQFGPDGKQTASIGYKTKDKTGAVYLGSPDIFATINGTFQTSKIIAKNANIGTFINEVKFKEKPKIYFKKDKKTDYYSLADYIKHIIDQTYIENKITKSFIQEKITKSFIQGNFDTIQVIGKDATISNGTWSNKDLKTVVTK